MIALARGQPGRARASWEQAQRMADGCGLAFEAAVISLELAENGGRRGAGALGTAQATFERLGARPWLARARGEAVTRRRANAR